MTKHIKELEYPLSVISNLANLIIADLTGIMPLGTDECDSMQDDLDCAIRKAEKIVECVEAISIESS